MASKFDLGRLLSLLDKSQTAADVAGVVDPTGVVDAGNAAVSMARAIVDKDRRGEHLKNAAISAISVIPFVGDLAKLAKIGPKTARSGAKGAGRGGRVSDSALDSGAAGEPHRSFSDVVNRGRNFGDILGGVKTPEQARQELEGADEERKAKERLIEVVKTLGGTFGALTVGSIALTKTIHAVGASLLERQRQELGGLNAGISVSAARLDISRLQRSIERGYGTERGFTRLAESIDGLERKMLPYQTALADVTNRTVSLAARFAELGIEVVEANTVIDDSIRLYNAMTASHPGGLPAASGLVKDIADGKLNGSLSRRPVGGPPTI